MDLRPHLPSATTVRRSAAVVAVAILASVWVACGRAPRGSWPAAGAGSGPPVARSPLPPPLSPSPSATSAAQARLQAARAVEQLVGLLDRHRYSAVTRLLRGPWVWPRRELVAIRQAHYLSARVWGDPSADRVVLAVQLRLAVTHRSPLSDGRQTLFFTMGRDGTSNDWLVAAVASGP